MEYIKWSIIAQICKEMISFKVITGGGPIYRSYIYRQPNIAEFVNISPKKIYAISPF